MLVWYHAPASGHISARHNIGAQFGERVGRKIATRVRLIVVAVSCVD